MRFTNSVVGLVLTMTMVACGESEKEDTAVEVAPEFLALTAALESQCTGCHGTSGDLSLAAADVVAETVDVESSGDATYMRVVCGDPDSSALYLKLFDPAPFFDPMPKNGTADQETIDAIYAWIDAGCPE
jgi:hypothetical protein